MFWTILRRELQGTLSSFTFLSSLAVLTILVLLSAHIQARYYQSIVEDYALRQSIHQAENRQHAIVLERPIPPLLPFFNGVYDSLPDEFRLRSDSVVTDPLSGDLTPLDWLFPKIDLSFIIGVLMTLIAILLSHNTIAGDREQGTLKLILVGSVQRRTVLFAKLTGVILQLTIILVCMMLLYIIVVEVFTHGTVDLSAANLGVLVVYVLVALLVLMVFVALGTAISTSVSHSSASLAVCASIWMGAILIGPSLGPFIVSSLKPVSTWEAAQREIAFKEREVIQAELADHRKTAAELKANNAGVESAWQRYLELRRKWVETRTREIGRLIKVRKNQILDQQLLARRISSLSPYVAFKEVLGNVCGTGLESYDEFLASVERYSQQEFLPASFDLLSRQKSWLGTAKPDGWFQLRPLQVPPSTLYKRLAAAAWPLGILMAEISLLVAVGFFSFERYDVRC